MRAVLLAIAFFCVGAATAPPALNVGVDLAAAAFAEAPLSTNGRQLIRVPLTRQATDWTCGAAAMQSVLGYYGDEFREEELAHKLHSNSKDGTNYRSMVAYAKAHGYSVSTKEEMSLDELCKLVDAGNPVICLIQAWPGKKVDFSQDWDDGHWVVAIGHDADNIYFMDPSTLGNYTYIPWTEFMQRWHDRERARKLNHFAMTITKAQPTYDPAAVKKME